MKVETSRQDDSVKFVSPINVHLRCPECFWEIGKMHLNLNIGVAVLLVAMNYSL